MSKLVIGLVGPICSGKGAVGDYLAHHGFAYQSLSDSVRDEVRSRQLPLERSVLQDVGNELRHTYGDHYWAERTLAKIDSNANLVVIDAIRNPGEIIYLRRIMGAAILAVNAPTELRLKWYLERAKLRGEDGATAESFYIANNRDLGLGEDNFGQQVSRCLQLADCVIENEGSREFLFETVNELIRHRYSLELSAGRRGVET